MTRKGLHVFFWVTALVYLISLYWKPYPLDFVFKSAPIFGLAVLVFLFSKAAGKVAVFTGLLFSAGGDIALNQEGENFFLIGLVLFLIAHIFYIAGFARERHRSQMAVFVTAGVVIFAIVLSTLMIQNVDSMLYPVLAYILIISAMTVAAAFRGDRQILFGAVIFMISDTIIAVNRFLVDLPLTAYTVMVTYYAAQYLIATGFARGEKT